MDRQDVGGPLPSPAYPHVPVPVELLLDADVSGPAAYMWALLYHYAATGGGTMFEFSIDQMAALCGVTSKTARSRRDELVEAGWIDVTIMPGLGRRQQITVKVPGQSVSAPQE
ncbi:hypothetical protein [Nocardioides sp. Leaf285]|uniref:hypothetical protein n=1 Tax=Nocardioides sp. Leaf285 TaxID=1736322 RepID=UPI0007039574|nr:hypothetical protein [Nocardioides sp. Leaf285]KQP63083.1 hypothetical protein ASF47_18910 [Nocardioides sp. Leaf285]